MSPPSHRIYKTIPVPTIIIRFIIICAAPRLLKRKLEEKLGFQGRILHTVLWSSGQSSWLQIQRSRV
jgi:hypothetical protein